MNTLQYWHPVIQSKKLGRKPVCIKLCGQEIVLFRGEQNSIGALKNSCPHRGMRLSEGWIKDNRLVCPYHGWSYDCDGKGFSPSTPQLHVCAQRFDIVERYGAIWIKSFDSQAEFPQLDFSSYEYICTLEHHVDAPLGVDKYLSMEHGAPYLKISCAS
ncbi:MAG: Rieske (2Fe-2S) protein [Calothrix sp. FI2-JRJ7]|jgi:vanillate O-demethylase monooxygenase subunit|nr:Rieske (2Fe-2S) protein [Calothrix sp. FI2-JRJ7]